MILVANNYQPEGLNLSFKKLGRGLKKLSVKSISLNNVAKVALAPISLATGVKINGMRDISLNNTVKIVATAAPIAVAFIPGIGPALMPLVSGVTAGITKKFAEKGTKVGLRDVSLKNGIDVAVSVGTSYATAGIGKGLDKLGGKLTSGSIGRAAGTFQTKLTNTGAGRLFNKYGGTAIGKVFVEGGKKIIKTAEGQIKDVITGVVIGTATNLLIKPQNQDGYQEIENQDGYIEEEHIKATFDIPVPNISQIQTIAKLTDKPVEQVIKEQITAKTVDTSTVTPPDTKGMSTGVKVVSGIAAAGLIWYLIK